MDSQELTRRQSTILSADVKDFSRLMSRNDVETVCAINRHRRLMAQLVAQHRGRVVDMAGDSLLAIFSSALAVVHCALDIQERLRAANRQLPQADRMCFRLGIDRGDVLHQDRQVYGEAVNIAARLQALAPPGGVFISSAVYRRVRSELPRDASYQGKNKLKNIPRRVTVYGLAPESGYCSHECGNKDTGTAFWQLAKIVAGAVMRFQESFFNGASTLFKKARFNSKPENQVYIDVNRRRFFNRLMQILTTEH
jgi:class 3 adenylate cyclase